MSSQKLISIVVPVFNEAPNIPKIVNAISVAMAQSPYKYEIILVDDGSTDKSTLAMNKVKKANKVICIHLSRNFGKEIALSAGLQWAKGDAVIMLDADLQHPPKLIPKFISKWQAGADVVVGVRKSHAKDSKIKSIGGKLFYTIMSRISKVPVVPHSTDYRLLDRQVVDSYNRFTEHNRIARGLIDWLGYHRDYIYFTASDRSEGVASYSTRKLIKLAADSFVSMSMVPLKLSGYLGIIIVSLSLPLGIFVGINDVFYSNSFSFSGPAKLGILTLFLIGVVMVNLGLISLYIAQIHSEVNNRPLYVIKKSRR